jgi:phage-related baseplate assembly protein
VESDPAYKVLEVAAYRELILRQRINDAAKACMLAYATGTDLDNLGALFNVQRLVITPANPDAIPPVEAVMESDSAFRKRIQLAFEGLSTAGSEGSYIYHALSADGKVKDVGIDSVTFHVDGGGIVIDHDAHLLTPEPGMVAVTVLSNVGNGAADGILLSAVSAALNAENVRPLTDRVLVRSAEIVEYVLEADITFLPGPSHATVLALIAEKWAEFAAKSHAVGVSLEKSAIHAVLHQAGVYKVEIVSPVLPLIVENWQAAYCSSVTLNNVGTI